MKIASCFWFYVIISAEINVQIQFTNINMFTSKYFLFFHNVRGTRAAPPLECAILSNKQGFPGTSRASSPETAYLLFIYSYLISGMLLGQENTPMCAADYYYYCCCKQIDRQWSKVQLIKRIATRFGLNLEHNCVVCWTEDVIVEYNLWRVHKMGESEINQLITSCGR